MPTADPHAALSPTMEEGKLVKWHVKEGDTVRSGDVIAEIETDKATMEVEAVDEGTIGKLLVAEGTEHVPVNQPIALLLTEDERTPQPRRLIPSRRGLSAAGEEARAFGQLPHPTLSLRRARHASSRRSSARAGEGITPSL